MLSVSVDAGAALAGINGLPDGDDHDHDHDHDVGECVPVALDGMSVYAMPVVDPRFVHNTPPAGGTPPQSGPWYGSEATFKLHSRASATKTIYLDFNGHLTKDTLWNNGKECVTPAYSVDSDPAFSDAELRNIQEVWARVVEDYAAFDVDVTTEEPALDDLIKKGTGDTRWGIRVAIGGSCDDWLKISCGGIAYLTSFNWDSDTPTFVFPVQLGNGFPKYVAEAVSHEVGHTLGLRHDGRTSPSEGYYAGHGSGATGWAPIMGVGYYQELVQWSKGEYLNADNKEDDLKIITTDNGFGYRADDYGNTVATAFAPQNLGTTPTTFAGVVTQGSDVDVFQVVTSGMLKAVAVPDAVSPDLDILAELWDSTGTVIATSNPIASLDASFDLKVPAGTYYVAIRGTGKGDRLSTGYTNYASIGQYSLGLAVTTTAFSVTPLAATRDEGNTGTTPFSFTVTRTGDSTGAATIDWAVTGSGASPASATDFAGGVFPAGKLAFAAGEESKIVTVPVAGDYLFEADEGFTFTLSNPNGGVIGTASAQGKIVNDDPRSPTLSIAATSAVKAEGNTGSTPFTFTVTRNGDPTTPVSARWSVTGVGLAPADALDFSNGLPPGGSVEFAAGESTKTIVVDVSGDTVIEADEGFVVMLSGVVGGVIDVGTAAGTIQNDDFPPPKVVIAATDAVKPEGNVGSTAFLFTVFRTGDLAGPTTVRWGVDGTGARPASPDDFSAGVFPTGVVTFAAGETTKTISIGVAGDARAEGDERFRVTLGEVAGATIEGGTADGVILNDDAVTSWLSIAAAASTQPEGDTGSRPFLFTVLRSGSLADVAMVNWSVSGSGAKPASADDFVDGVLPSGSLSFAPGQSSKVITVNVRGDAAIEFDETFAVTLTDAAGAAVRVAVAYGSIVNDDLAPSSVTITANGTSRPEGNFGSTFFTFVLTRQGGNTRPASLAWSVVPTAGKSVNGADFVGGGLPSGIVNFAAGEVTKTIAVPVAGDVNVEDDETFAVVLSNPVGVLLAREQAFGVIANDDTTLAFASTRIALPEGQSGSTAYVYTVERSGVIDQTSTVAWEVTGTGVNPASSADFLGAVFPRGVLVFAPKQLKASFTVSVKGDLATEQDEEFTITLSSATNARIDGATAIGVIGNDDGGTGAAVLAAAGSAGIHQPASPSVSPLQSVKSAAFAGLASALPWGAGAASAGKSRAIVASVSGPQAAAAVGLRDRQLLAFRGGQRRPVAADHSDSAGGFGHSRS